MQVHELNDVQHTECKQPCVWIACLTYLCEALTTAWTLVYTVIQAEEPGSLNGFCLCTPETHLFCAFWDVFVVGVYVVYIYMADKMTWHNGVVSFALWAHWISHYHLYDLTKDMNIIQINQYRHWSFTLVLIGVNLAYCLPRLFIYGPTNVHARSAPSDVIASVGIFVLMACAWLERFYCENFMLYLGGHLTYDLLISVVALAIVIYQADKKPWNFVVHV